MRNPIFESKLGQLKYSTPMEFDSFIWFHIASFLNDYNDLISLKETCQHLSHVCSELSIKFHQHHLDQIALHLKEMKLHINYLHQLNNDVANEDLCSTKEQFYQSMKSFKRKCNRLGKSLSDACFISWLLTSPHNALITCVNRNIDIVDYHCIDLSIQVRSWDDVNFDIRSQCHDSFWFNQLEEHAKSTLEFAFFQCSQLTETNADDESGHVDCYFWFKKQPFPENNTMIQMLGKYGKMSQFWVEDNKIIHYDRFSSEFNTIACDKYLWDTLLCQEMFIVNTFPQNLSEDE